MDNPNGSSTEQLHLKVQPQPPPFPFCDDFFDLTVYLVHNSEHLKCGSILPLRVELLFSDTSTPVGKPILKIDDETQPCIQKDGICRLRVKITNCSMAHGNRKFCLSFSTSSANLGSIAPFITTDMFVVNHRLVIQEALPELWYKDEGGRDKCIVLPVFLINEKGEKVTDRELPLRVTLLYEDEHYVTKQDILKISPDSQRVIDSSGQALLRLRIEDVSKNHQGQAFRIKVESDTQQSPMNFDVSYDLSTTISVRSKRNKRVRPRVSTNVPSPTSHYSTTHGTAPAPSTLRMTLEDEDDSLAHREAPEASPTALAATSAPQASTAPVSVNTAMGGIIQWAGTVVNGLHRLEWQLIGYESKSDGTPDQSRPLYRCPSCWRYKDVLTYHSAQHGPTCVLANILMTYATETMMHLHTLLKTVEEIAGGEQTDGAVTVSSQMESNRMSPQEAKRHPQMQPQHQLDEMPQFSNLGAFSSNIGSAGLSSTAPPHMSRGISEVVGSLDMPSLLRGASVGLQDIVNSFGGGGPSVQNGFEFGRSILESVEEKVFYVLAKIYVSAAGPVGFPAFDRNQQLLGFYQEGHDNATTEVIFVPLQALSHLGDRDVQQSMQMLSEEVKVNSGALHSLPKCNNNLVKLKEDALMFHWGCRTTTMSPIMY